MFPPEFVGRHGVRLAMMGRRALVELRELINTRPEVDPDDILEMFEANGLDFEATLETF
jgi:hypothetical protein